MNEKFVIKAGPITLVLLFFSYIMILLCWLVGGVPTELTIASVIVWTILISIHIAQQKVVILANDQGLTIKKFMKAPQIISWDDFRDVQIGSSYVPDRPRNIPHWTLVSKSMGTVVLFQEGSGDYFRFKDWIESFIGERVRSSKLANVFYDGQWFTLSLSEQGYVFKGGPWKDRVVKLQATNNGYIDIEAIDGDFLAGEVKPSFSLLRLMEMK